MESPWRLQNYHHARDLIGSEDYLNFCTFSSFFKIHLLLVFYYFAIFGLFCYLCIFLSYLISTSIQFSLIYFYISSFFFAEYDKFFLYKNFK